MPELPEVETVVRGLGKLIPSTAVSRVVSGRIRKLRPKGLKSLAGKKLLKVSRRGKNILLWFDSGQVLVIHLGMTGQLYWDSPDGRTDRHTHLRLWFAGDNQVLYFRDARRFGQIRLYACAKTLWSDEKFRRLGREPLEISLSDFRKLLARRRMLKALLLDQSVIVGFGNIYVDESLFAAGIHPARRADTLSLAETARLYRAMKRIFAAAIAAGGSTIRDYRQGDGSLGRFQTRHRIYQRTGKPCPRCKQKIQRLIVAGRGTHICPACQPLDSVRLS